MRVAIVSTGGTIDMVPGPSGFRIDESGTAPGRPPEGAVPSGYETEQFKLFALPSPHMTPSRMAELCRFLGGLAASGMFDGIVVTHGTDTLEESAFLADVSLGSSCPVVFTAAMRSSSELGVDGPRNLRGAILTATCPEFRNFGVAVVLNDEIHAAGRVTKTYTSNVSSFASPGYGPLGFVDEDRVFLVNRPCWRLELPPGELYLDERVGLVRTAAGLGARELRFCRESGDRAVVLEAFGRGNVPPDVADEVGESVRHGMLVAVVSRCYVGRVLGVYGYPGGGSDLASRGAMLAGDMHGHKLRLFLMAALGAGLDREAVSALLERL
ncbi:MAG: asparaginase [Candidatus Fermentibacter sp.]|nr:asparaginase [Candidatus Fermentibacter sp.]